MIGGLSCSPSHKAWVKNLESLAFVETSAKEEAMSEAVGGSEKAIQARFIALAQHWHVILTSWIKTYNAYLFFSGVRVHGSFSTVKNLG